MILAVYYTNQLIMAVAKLNPSQIKVAIRQCTMTIEHWIGVLTTSLLLLGTLDGKVACLDYLNML